MSFTPYLWSGDMKGVCGTPDETVYPLNFEADYLGSWEEHQDLISGPGVPPAVRRD